MWRIETADVEDDIAQAYEKTAKKIAAGELLTKNRAMEPNRVLLVHLDVVLICGP